MTKEVLFILGIFLILGNAMAQEAYPYPSLSPAGKISQEVGNTFVQIEYERPSVRKRKIFGELVPWNKVWRTGAGHCTKISFDKPVTIGGQRVDGGKYSLFSIPNVDEWGIILNKDTSLYGSSNYNPDKDVARFIAIPTTTSRHYETLNFDIELVPNHARIYLSWANVTIHFDIETSTDAEIETFIQNELLTGKSKESNLYAGAAEYHLYQGSSYSEALYLTEKALELDKDNGWARNLRIQLYSRQKLYNKALAEIEIAIQEIKSSEYEDETVRRNELKSLQERSQSIEEKMKR